LIGLESCAIANWKLKPNRSGDSPKPKMRLKKELPVVDVEDIAQIVALDWSACQQTD